MKKMIALLVVVMTVGFMSVPAFAHGGHGRGRVQSQTGYEVCSVSGCAEIGLHEHDGTWYHCADYGTRGCAGGYCC